MHAHVCSMGTLGTSLATTSEQPHMRYAYRKPNAGIVCIRRRRISFYSFFRWCVFRSASNHLRTYLRSRDYCQIYNGYLLICAVLYPRSFSRCAYAICHIVGDLHTRVLKGRKRGRFILPRPIWQRNKTRGNRFLDDARFVLMIVHYFLVLVYNGFWYDVRAYTHDTTPNESGFSVLFVEFNCVSWIGQRVLELE